MSSPIINPWVVYWISVASNFSLIFTIVLILCVFGLVVFICMWVEGCDDNTKLAVIGKHGTIGCMIAMLVSTVIVAIIPSEKTMYTMLVTKYITVENINAGTETVKSAVDYVFEKIDELNDSK